MELRLFLMLRATDCIGGTEPALSHGKKGLDDSSTPQQSADGSLSLAGVRCLERM